MATNQAQLQERIAELKREKQAVILAHYYTTPEVQAVADFLGDSLALAVKAQSIEAPTILFAGVHFMAETAKVLCPQKRVLIPCPEASCSLAESCPAEELARLKAQHPDHVVVSYVNTTVGVKAHTDICCTSSNALQVVESLPREQPILFAPDRNLGSYIKRMTGRENILLWEGACHVHEEFSLERLRAQRAAHPEAKVVVHPECPEELVREADFVGSTAAILSYCEASDSETFLVVTEPGIIAEMEKRMPSKRFIAALPKGEADCNACHYMKMVTLENIISCLEQEAPEVVIEESVRQAAERSILNMIAIK